MERTGGWLGLRLGLESGCSAVKGTLALLCLQDKALASRTGALSVPAAVTSTQCGSCGNVWEADAGSSQGPTVLPSQLSPSAL